MITDLQIKDFKIISKITVSNLEKINIFIGKNGSGKSSILEFLSICLGNRFDTDMGIEEVLNATYGTTKLFNNTIGELDIHTNNGNKYSATLKSVDGDIEFINSIKSKTEPYYFYCDYFNPTIINPNIMVPATPFNVSEIDNGAAYIDDVFQADLDDGFFTNENIIGFFDKIICEPINEAVNSNITNIRQLSTGYKSLLNLFLRIHIFLDHDPKNDVERVFLVEEPEYGLHAEFQKLFLKVLDFFNHTKLQFFVSTHSSVIVNDAKKRNLGRIWFLQNGNTIDLEKNEGCGISGYSPYESVSFSASLMGIENNDIGYPENFCLVEESSLIDLLKPIFSSPKSFLKNIFYVAVGGESKFEQYDTNQIQQFKSQDTLIKCNPFYSDTYILIVDKYNGKSINAKLVRYLNNRKDRLNTGEFIRFVELSEDGIEGYYKNDEMVFEQIETLYLQLKELKGVELGKQKSVIAQAVGKLIIESDSPIDLFRKIFNNELKILIKKA